MGLCASYIAISDADDDQIFNLYQDEQLESIIEELDELEDSSDVCKVNINEMWDGLHYLFTKSSLYYPIIDNYFSFVFAGENILDLFENEHIGLNTSSLTKTINGILEHTDIDYYLDLIEDFSDFTEENIYPEIWDGNIVELKKLLKDSFLTLKEFYKNASDNNLNVAVYIRDKS